MKRSSYAYQEFPANKRSALNSLISSSELIEHQCYEIYGTNLGQYLGSS